MDLFGDDPDMKISKQETDVFAGLCSFFRQAILLSATLAACAAIEITTPPATQTPLPTATETPTPILSTPTATECAKVLHPPWFYEVVPNPVIAGGEFKLTGQGGFVTDCSGWDESARAFDIYLDDKPFGSIICYVNYCQGNFILPPDTPPGTHCLSLEPGACALEFQSANR